MSGQAAESRGLFQWMSKLLGRPITDADQLQSGILLISLVERLFDEKIEPGTYKLLPRNEFDMALNHDCALRFLKSKGIKVPNCSGEAIVKGNVESLLGLLSTMFFKCPSLVSEELAAISGDPLLQWVQRTLEPAEIRVTNWVSSWSDGRAIYTLVGTVLPCRLNLADCVALSPADRESRAIVAFQSLDIAVYVVSGDIITVGPGSKIVQMIVQEIYIYTKYPPHPPWEVEPPMQAIPPPVESDWLNEELEVPWFDTSLPRPPTKFALGIDLGSSKVRYNLFSTDNPDSAVDAQVIDAWANVDRSGAIFVCTEGLPPPPDSAPLPSLQRLLGRQFADPSIAPIKAHYPLPIIEDANTHQCAVDFGGGSVTPEQVTTALLAAVREKAAQTAGQEVVDVSISVPALFTSAQRTSVRTAAENAGLHVAHIASSPLVAAQAMKATGQLETLGQALIVDVGASKTEVALVQNSGDSIRELRTVGTDAISSENVRDNIVNLCLPLLENVKESADPFVIIKLCSAVEAALESEPDSRRIVVADLGNGKGFEKELSEFEIAQACEPIAASLQQLIDLVVPLEDKSDVKAVRCVGGGTLLASLQQPIKNKFPDADFAQVDPNSTVVWGATLDSAQMTNRLPQEKRANVIAVAPYSIGVGISGDVISFLIYRGEPLPASGEFTAHTTVDNQKSAKMIVYQGEHFITKNNDPLGDAELTDLPPMPRWKCNVLVRVEYDCDGILRFSAREESTGQSVNAELVSKTDFTDEDRARLTIASGFSREVELKQSNVQSLRQGINLDIIRAESQTGGRHLIEAVNKWREWLKANEDGPVRMFIEKRYKIQCEFHAIHPDEWQVPEPLPPDHQFSVIWPIEPTFTHQGAAIIRFLTAADYQKVLLEIIHTATKVTTDDYEIAQFPLGGKIETIARVCFPGNGRYIVRAFAGLAGQETLQCLSEKVYGISNWIFDVQGAPPPSRPLVRLITDRPMPPLNCIETLQVTPGESTLRVSQRVHRFTCRFRGELGINGREPKGEPQQVVFPERVTESSDDGWSVAKYKIEFPSDGMWRLIFFIDDRMAAVQLLWVGSGGVLELTNIERAALKAPLPILLS
jgi:L1 cell adhesion molecule like protein